MRLQVYAAALLAGVLTTGARASPSTQERPQFRAGVDLVQIDVVALDKDGHPVRGLTAADFTLADRTKVQRIATFKEVTIGGAGAPPPLATIPQPAPAVKLDVASNQIPPADRLVVMVLDDLHVFRQRSDRVKDIAHKVANALGPQSSMAVLFTSGHHDTEFTRDPADISAAIDTFAGTPVRRPGPGSDDPRTPFKHDPLAKAPPYSEQQDVQHFFDDLSLPKTIGDAAHMLLSTESPRKAFVLVSESTASNLTGMYKGPLTPCQIRDRTQANPCMYQRALQNAVENLERANITLYAFDPRGAVANVDISLECAPGKPGPPGRDPCVGPVNTSDQNWIRYAQQGLTLTAEAAGGFAVTNSDDFDGGIARLRQEIDHYYLLGFSPTDPSGHGFRPVTVTVNRPGVTLHYRRGYVLGPTDVDRENADPLVAMSSGILPRTDLPLRLSATAMSVALNAPKRKAATRVLAILEATLPPVNVPELRYGLLAANLDTGKVEGDVTNTVTPSSRPSGQGPPGTNLRVEVPIELTLPPGRYQLRASALSAAVEKGGSVYLITDVPDLASGTLVLGNPILGSTQGETGVLVQGPATAQLPFTPTLDRTFDQTDVLQVFCPLTHRPGAVPHVTLSIMAGDDHIALSTMPEVDTADNHPILANVSLADLAPGAYQLRIRATDGQQTAQRVLPIVIK